jgi:hypothetical protein
VSVRFNDTCSRLVEAMPGIIGIAGLQLEDEFDFAVLSFGAAFDSVGV